MLGLKEIYTTGAAAVIDPALAAEEKIAFAQHRDFDGLGDQFRAVSERNKATDRAARRWPAGRLSRHQSSVGVCDSGSVLVFVADPGTRWTRTRTELIWIDHRCWAMRAGPLSWSAQYSVSRYQALVLRVPPTRSS